MKYYLIITGKDSGHACADWQDAYKCWRAQIKENQKEADALGLAGHSHRFDGGEDALPPPPAPESAHIERALWTPPTVWEMRGEEQSAAVQDYLPVPGADRVAAQILRPENWTYGWKRNYVIVVDRDKGYLFADWRYAVDFWRNPPDPCRMPPVMWELRKVYTERVAPWGLKDYIVRRRPYARIYDPEIWMDE